MRKFYKYLLFQLTIWLIAYNLPVFFVFIIVRQARMTGDYISQDISIPESIAWGLTGGIFVTVLLIAADFYFERIRWQFKSQGSIIFRKSAFYILLRNISLTSGKILLQGIKEPKELLAKEAYEGLIYKTNRV